MEIWSINKKGRLSSHLSVESTQEADTKMIELSKEYPNRVFIIANHLVARRVINNEVVCENVYG